MYERKIRKLERKAEKLRKILKKENRKLNYQKQKVRKLKMNLRKIKTEIKVLKAKLEAHNNSHLSFSAFPESWPLWGRALRLRHKRLRCHSGVRGCRLRM